MPRFELQENIPDRDFRLERRSLFVSHPLQESLEPLSFGEERSLYFSFLRVAVMKKVLSPRGGAYDS